MDYHKIKKPTLVLDEGKCRKNIRSMSEKAKKSGVIFRPHFKTHQSATVGEWYREEGITNITVSSVTMARYFSGCGWNNITIAFPFNTREIDEAKETAEHSSLNILISGIEHLQEVTGKINFEAGCFIKFNTGYNRSGVEWNDYETIVRMVDDINKNKYLRMKGFLTHSGHTYHASSAHEVLEIFNDTILKTGELKKHLSSSDLIYSMGDTPSCSIAEDFPGFDEIRPGNFVFYDLMQCMIGSCRREQIAVAVICPVADVNKRRNEVIIYGGAIHLSKDSIMLYDGSRIFGEAAFPSENGWEFPGERIFVKSLSQEHGILSVPEKYMKEFHPGSLVAVIPVHACLAVDLLREYHLPDGRLINSLSPK